MDITYYLTYDLPVPYRNIKLYPITVKDYLYFNVYAQCLTIDKNSIPKPEIIRMTELEYIFYASQQDFEKQPYIVWLDRLLSLSLRDDKSFEKIEESIRRYNYSEDGKPYFLIGDEKYRSKDYDELRKLIAEQNLVELPDTNIAKEVRDAMDAAREYKRKQSGAKSASWEDYIISIASETGWSLEYIYNMSARKFLKTIRRLDNSIHYKIYLAASMSGMVEFKDKSFIKHWLTDIEEEDKYGDVSISMDEIQNKISMESAKQKGG